MYTVETSLADTVMTSQVQHPEPNRAFRLRRHHLASRRKRNVNQRHCRYRNWGSELRMPLGNNVCSMDSMCFLVSPPPLGSLRFSCNGRGTRAFVSTTAPLFTGDCENITLLLQLCDTCKGGKLSSGRWCFDSGQRRIIFIFRLKLLYYYYLFMFFQRLLVAREIICQAGPPFVQLPYGTVHWRAAENTVMNIWVLLKFAIEQLLASQHVKSTLIQIT